MIFGIGSDIASISRFRTSLLRFGVRLPKRLLGAEELQVYRLAPDSAAFLARRFAAKEAALKALGCGLSRGISWHDISVSRRANSRPLLHFGGPAADLLQEYAIMAHHLTISDDGDYAIAFVVLEQNS